MGKSLFQKVIGKAEKLYPRYSQERLDFIKSSLLEYMDGKLFCEITDNKGDLYAVSDNVIEAKLLSNDLEQGFHFHVLMNMPSDCVLADVKDSIGPWKVFLKSESDSGTTLITEHKDKDTAGINDHWKVTFDYKYGLKKEA